MQLHFRIHLGRRSTGAVCRCCEKYVAKGEREFSVRAIGIVALYALVNPQTMWLKFSPSRMPQTY